MYLQIFRWLHIRIVGFLQYPFFWWVFSSFGIWQRPVAGVVNQSGLVSWMVVDLLEPDWYAYCFKQMVCTVKVSLDLSSDAMGMHYIYICYRVSSDICVGKLERQPQTFHPHWVVQGMVLSLEFELWVKYHVHISSLKFKASYLMDSHGTLCNIILGKVMKYF